VGWLAVGFCARRCADMRKRGEWRVYFRGFCEGVLLSYGARYPMSILMVLLCLEEA
jgi:hypothetical protein